MTGKKPVDPVLAEVVALTVEGCHGFRKDVDSLLRRRLVPSFS
jgi:hypothetical protein